MFSVYIFLFMPGLAYFIQPNYCLKPHVAAIDGAIYKVN